MLSLILLFELSYISITASNFGFLYIQVCICSCLISSYCLYCASASAKHEKRSLLQSCAWLWFQINLNHSFVCHLMRISSKILFCLTKSINHCYSLFTVENQLAVAQLNSLGNMTLSQSGMLFHNLDSQGFANPQLTFFAYFKYASTWTMRYQHTFLLYILALIGR